MIKRRNHRNDTSEEHPEPESLSTVEVMYLARLIAGAFVLLVLAVSFVVSTISNAQSPADQNLGEASIALERSIDSGENYARVILTHRTEYAAGFVGFFLSISFSNGRP